MKKFLLPVISLLIFVLGETKTARASHYMGVDLTYECLAPGQYKLHLQIYRDCNGIGVASSFQVNYSSAQCGVDAAVTLSQVGPPTDITPVCSQQTSTACNGAGAYGIQKYVFEGTLNLPVGCGNDWVLSWTDCCRNGAITDLAQPSSENIYIEDCLDNTQSPCVSSPVFLNNPVPFFCVGVPVNYNHGVVDVAGDSLVFQNVCCLNAAGSPVAYGSGLSCNQPFVCQAGAGLTINSQNGDIHFTPSQQQIGVMSVLVSAYRNGQVVSCVARDMEFTIIPCTGQPPTASGFGSSTSTDYTLTIPACADTCINIFSNDPGNSVVTMTWDQGIPTATMGISGSPFPTGTFCWSPTIADTGTHFFTLTVANNNCPIVGSNTYSYRVNVVPSNSPPVNAGPDVILCPGQSTTLNATVVGGTPTNYRWSDGNNVWTTQSITVNPASTTQYTVSAYYANGCIKTDNVLVTRAPNPNISIFPTNITVCSSGSVALSVSTTAINPTYYWSPTTNLSCTNCSNPIASPTSSTQYCVSITDQYNCPSNQVCSQITFSPPPPPQACAVIYATTNGTGTGTQASPTNLAGAIALAQCNNALIKLGTGTYTIDNPITNITSYTTIEGGFNPATWVKTSQAGATTIYRSNLNPEGPPNAQRIVGIYLNSQSYFRFQDLTFQTQDCPASNSGPGWSNYVFHLTNCSNYDFVRCQILPGNGGKGQNGLAGARGADGGNGSNGNNGDVDNQVAATSGPGGAGGGVLPGSAGTAASNGASGGNGGASSDTRSGGGGGAGGSGGYSAANGGDGGTGGGVNGGAGTATFGAGGASSDPGLQGQNGTTGANGTNGLNGTLGSAGTHASGFFVPGGQGGTGDFGTGGAGGSGGGGGGGQNAGTPGTGDGGGGGGGGGQGGAGGEGGWGGGGAFGVYLYNNGNGGNFTDCFGVAPTGGASGTPGAGGNGGNGGSGGLGSTYGTAQVGAGGNGGWGGNGGQGGTGGFGIAGSAVLTYRDGGNSLATADTTFNLSGQTVINVDNVNCTYHTVTFSSAASNNWGFGSGSNPTTGTGASSQTQYSTFGRKDITYAAQNYTGFYNVPIDQGSYIPSITTTAHQYDLDTFILCQGSSADFNAIIPGADIFDWDFGGAINPNTYTGANYQNLTGLTFNTVGVFKIKLRISTSCCGWSPYDSIYLIVDQQPLLHINGLLAFCPGDSTTLTASGATNYTWSPATGLNTTVGPTVIAKPSVSTSYLISSNSLYNFCNVDSVINITIKLPPTLSFTTSPATCGANGSITVTASPAGSYTYQWNDAANQTTATASTLPPGAYAVTVTDITSNCTATDGAALGAGGGIQAYIDSSQNASCNGRCDGIARVHALGASGTYTYHWNTGPTTALITGLCANTYTVTVNDANTTCTATATVTIAQPLPLTITVIDSVQPTCANHNDGSILGNADGGTGPFQFLWNDPGHQDSAHAVHLYPGTYTLIVVDQMGCFDSSHITLFAPPPPVSDTLNIIDVSCFGLSDGAITVTTNSGVAPYTYSWQQFPAVTDTFLTNLPVGNYTVYVTDSHGCSDTINNITINQPAVLSETVVVDSVKCFGGNTGSIQINASGGTTPYQYSIDGVNFQASSTFANLTAGNYTASITDAHGCTKSTPVTVYQPALLVAQFVSKVDELCFGARTGSITISITGGTPNYTGTTGGQTVSSAPYQFNNLAAGNYTITVTDANSCTASTSATINEPTQLQLALVSTTPATCYGTPDGGLVVSANGGTPAYLYSLNGGTPQASGTFINIIAGFEVVAVTDANQCIDTIHVNVPQPPQTTFLDTNVVDVNCFGESNGSIDLIVTGTGGPWTYHWSNSGTTQDISGLPAGTYSVTVTEAGGCSAAGLGAIVVNQPAVIAVTDVVANVKCNGGSDGCITVTTTGGTPAYNYTWNTGNGCNIPAGTYAVTVTDAHGCRDSIANMIVTEPPLLTVTATGTDVSCPGFSDGSVLATPAGGTTPYSYAWSNGETSNPDVNLPKGSYTVTVTDNNLCTATATQTIIELPGIIISGTAHNVLCVPLHNGSVELTVQTNNPPATFAWSNGMQGQNIYGLGNGTYTVTISDANNCIRDTSFVITTDTAAAVIAAPHDTTINLGNSVEITLNSNGVGGNIATVLWQPSAGLSCSDCVAPTASPIQTIYYGVSVTTDSGCIASDTVHIEVIPIYDIFIPNVFTPNGDGINDFFEVFGNKIAWKQFEVQVFDRIGELVYQSNDMNFQFDGMYKGKYIQPSVLVYQIHVTYIDNHTDKLYKGSVTLVR